MRSARGPMAVTAGRKFRATKTSPSRSSRFRPFRAKAWSPPRRSGADMGEGAAPSSLEDNGAGSGQARALGGKLLGFAFGEYGAGHGDTVAAEGLTRGRGDRRRILAGLRDGGDAGAEDGSQGVVGVVGADHRGGYGENGLGILVDDEARDQQAVLGALLGELLLQAGAPLAVKVTDLLQAGAGTEVFRVGAADLGGDALILLHHLI